MLPTMGGPELLIILVIILLLFGVKRVPQLGRSLGSGIREFRKGAGGADDNKDQLEDRTASNEEGQPSLSGAARD